MAAASWSPHEGAGVVVVELGELDDELVLEGVEDAEGELPAEVVSDAVEPAPGVPDSQAAVAARASAAMAVRRRRGWRRGCSVTDRTYPAAHAATKPPTEPSDVLWQDRAMAIPVVLDVDTGVDDACALLLAALHPALDLRAVTCVGGNAPVDAVVANTLTVLDAAERPDVPVARGAERPLLEEPVDARHVHGQDGMGDLDWDKSAREPDPRHAVELLRDVLLDAAQGDVARRVTLIPLAPLTNIALLLRTHPSVAKGIREIVFMGGAVEVGNATASAEFNVFHDPEAAAVVLDACADLDIQVTMYGLDVFYAPRVGLETARTLSAPGGHDAADLAGRLIAFQCERFGSTDATIGDAGAVCAVLEPAGVRRERLPVRVELAGTWSRGRTIVDRRDWSGDLSHDPHGQARSSIDVCLEVDAQRYATLWLDTVGGGMR